MPLSRRSLLAGSAAAASAALIAAPPTAGEEQDSAKIASLGKTKNTKFAVNCEMWWNKLPFLERLRKAAEFGFSAVEFWPYQGKDIAAVKKLKDELQLDIAQFTAWGFEPGMNDPKQEDSFVGRIEEACQVAHQLDCQKMCVVAGNNQKGMTKDQMHAQVIKALKRAAPVAEREKVMLILEPMNGRVDHPGHCLYGSEDAVKICRAVDSPMVKINWDLYHMQIAEGDLCGRLKEGFDQLGYLQLADHPGRNEPGTGEIYYSRVLRQAKELGYTGYVGLELRPKTTELNAAMAVNKADEW
ncbi:MAG TPA: TIM barrel protein [Pirellulaceae bacterium]|nr:TIM barrel protein [Pirellulaceae bacterium]